VHQNIGKLKENLTFKLLLYNIEHAENDLKIYVPGIERVEGKDCCASLLFSQLLPFLLFQKDARELINKKPQHHHLKFKRSDLYINACK